MNKIRYIAIVAAGLFIMSSCQKNDFEEAFDQAEETVLQSQSSIPEASSSEANANDDNPPIDLTEDDKPTDIFVKEVSDGDDESDNDDNG